MHRFGDSFEFVEKTEFLRLEMSLNKNAWKSQIFPKITINKES